MKKLIQDYLSAPDERRKLTLEKMLETPDRAFEALVTFRGPYPPDLPVLDVYPDYIQPLICELIKRVPKLLVKCDLSGMTEGQRWILVYAAIEAKNPKLAPIIIAALNDTEDSGRDLAIKAVVQAQYLRTNECRKRLLKLRDSKSTKHLHDEIESALNSFIEGQAVED